MCLLTCRCVVFKNVSYLIFLNLNVSVGPLKGRKKHLILRKQTRLMTCHGALPPEGTLLFLEMNCSFFRSQDTHRQRASVSSSVLYYILPSVFPSSTRYTGLLLCVSLDTDPKVPEIPLCSPGMFYTPTPELPFCSYCSCKDA